MWQARRRVQMASVVELLQRGLQDLFHVRVLPQLPLALSLGCDVLMQVMLSLGSHIMLCMVLDSMFMSSRACASATFYIHVRLCYACF